MKIQFNKLRIHHFMSFDDAEVTLSDRGYCLIKGVNENPKDAAKSNGSGKSTIFNAISFALTGETLQGLKSNLANIYFDDGCYVDLEFDIDKDTYRLVRYKDDADYGTNLKIYLNGEDKSGKGIRESQEILDTYLPDLTSELIGSVIILGQGLPQKFTANTPSGRKEVLEHLSKSDFMIQDLKNRIENRLTELNNKNTVNNNEKISISSQLEIFKTQQQSKNTEYLEYQIENNYESELNRLKEEYAKKNCEVAQAKEEFDKFDKLYKDKYEELNKLTTDFSTKKSEIDSKHHEIELDFTTKISNQKNDIRNLENEVTKLKNITDICPTCGQKIPNVIKPDTTKQEEQLIYLTKNLEELVKSKEQDDAYYKESITALKQSFDSAISTCTDEKTKCYLDAQEAQNKGIKLENEANSLLAEASRIANLKDNFETNKKRVESELKTINESIDNLTKAWTEKKEVEAVLSTHIEAVNKMNTLIKRDFRGILLQDIITFIDRSAKEYCSKIFNTDEISIALDGNSIDITFCNKDYENLSGGEKQRVDCIVQFAIRKMMTQYLNFSSNILVLDEITDALDSVSCDKVIDFITRELNDIESVFIISHHSDELAIPCDSEIVVTKDIHGVSRVTKQ